MTTSWTSAFDAIRRAAVEWMRKGQGQSNLPEYVPEDATIHLTPDEALVLYELIARWFDDKNPPGPEHFESSSEWAALSAVLGPLESTLVAPFRSDYDQLLQGARERLTARWEGTNDEP